MRLITEPRGVLFLLPLRFDEFLIVCQVMCVYYYILFHRNIFLLVCFAGINITKVKSFKIDVIRRFTDFLLYFKSNIVLHFWNIDLTLMNLFEHLYNSGIYKFLYLLEYIKMTFFINTLKFFSIFFFILYSR